MRSALIFSLVLMIAGVARAQEQPAPTPDYSRDHLRQIFTTETQPKPPGNFHVGPGYVEFRALGMEWRVGFLPILAPLHGSVPGTTRVLPDAFSMTGLTFPGGPPVITRDATERRELRRIERMTKEPMRVTVQTE